MALTRKYDEQINKNIVDLTETDDEDEEVRIDEDDEDDDEEVDVEFKIVFPTLNTVKNSLVGPDGFGTLFCKIKDFQSPNFPSDSFHDCVTKDGNRCKYAMHSKIMTISSRKTGKGCFNYCGSHNFTASAWGKTTKQGSMLMVNNFEVGVLIPASEWNCEYPYLRPARKYELNDLPWYQNDYFQQ